MFRKFFSVLLVLLLFINACEPAYAEDEEVYTLEPGKVYRFRNSDGVGAVFSDYVLRGGSVSSSDYNNVYFYKYSDNVKVSSLGTLFVYNCNNKPVTMTVVENKGRINGFDVFEPFSIVMYDASETDFKMTNNSDGDIRYKKFEYDEGNDSFVTPSGTEWLYSVRTLTGRGFLLFSYNKNDLEDNITLEGNYEVSDYVRKGFFQGPPWILKMDLAGMIRALLDQLSMLLPVALVILSVFLLISLMKFIIRSFL